MKRICKNCTRWYGNYGWLRSYSLECSGENPNHRCNHFAKVKEQEEQK